MTTDQQLHRLALIEIAREYARIRAALVATRDDALETAQVSALQIELADLEALRVQELLRELEGDEEFVAS
jgi:hypothetical protein